MPLQMVLYGLNDLRMEEMLQSLFVRHLPRMFF